MATQQRNSSRVAGRREQLLDVAAKVFAEKGYQRTTTREVGELAGLGTGSMYYYFSSKEEIVRELIGRYWKDLFGAYNVVRATTDSANSRLAGLIQASMTVSHQHIAEVTILHQDWPALKDIEPHLEKWMNELQQEWISTIRAGIKDGSFKEDIDPTLVYRMIMGAISWFPRWYRPSGQYAIDDIAKSQASLLLSGISREQNHE
jgi:AcrR family transcriptional regulator